MRRTRRRRPSRGHGSPRFAGERRFYPWLTVIAGNICTDMLRRRSRSTPTDDMELTAQHPVGVVGEDTSEELILAAVDGELVNRALDRLSERHRHVLAMREGSGWSYQEIADHEGVEIGTIETLLWRARQALKREFAVVSDSKGALAGFLIATGALFRRTIFRLAHRGASVQQQSGNGALRDAVTGIAITGAAVAAAITAPIALLDAPSHSAAAPAPASSTLADPPLVVGGPSTAAATPAHTGGTSGATGGSGGSSNGSASGGGLLGGVGSTGGLGSLGGVGGSGGGLSGGLNQAAGGVTSTVNGATNTVGGAVRGVTNGLGGVANGAGAAVGGVTNGAAGGATNPISSLLGGVTSGLSGGATSFPSTGSTGSGSGPAPTTTTTTPVGGVAGGLGNAVNGLLGGG